MLYRADWSGFGRPPAWLKSGRSAFDPAPDHHPTTDLTSENAGDPLPLLVLPVTVVDH